MTDRHTYEKVAEADALIFAYNTKDTRNSYRGEPTTNLITDTAAFDSAFWNQKNGTITANDQIGPRGIQNAAEIVATNTDPYIYSSAIVTASTGNVTWSIWVKGVGSTVGKSAQVRINFSGTATGTADTNASVNLTNDWQLLQTTANVTGAGTIKFGLEAPNGAVSGDIMYFADPMFEQKSHATPFVNGTRSDTQGLLDLTGKTTANIGSVSFNSNSQITYESGSNDRVSITDPGYPSTGTDAFTLEAIFKIPNDADWYIAGSGTGIIGRGSYGGSIGIIRSSTNNRVAFWTRLDGGNIFDPAILNISRDVYHHVIGTYDGAGVAKIYHNGEYIAQESGATTGTFDAGGYNIGGGNSFGGVYGRFGEADDIPVFKLYNRDLTAGEVLNNYNNYKKRFDL